MHNVRLELGQRNDLQVTLAAGGVEVEMLPDFYGERAPRMSVLVYGAKPGELDAQLRFDASGKLVEIFAADSVRVVRGNEASPWFEERDGS